MKKLIALFMCLTLCLSMFAACGKQGGGEEQGANDADNLASAGAYLFSLYKDDSEMTPSDYDVVGRVMVDGVAYTVEWTVDVAEGVVIKESEKNGFFTIDINEKTETEIAYTLTATVKSESGETVQKTFKRKVPAYKEFGYADYAAAENGAVVAVKGIVTGIFSKTNGSSGNGVYIQDMLGEGGYYVYGLKDGKDPQADLGLEVGMTVEVAGTKDTYNGLYEIIDASITINEEAGIQIVVPVDYTDAMLNATALNDPALTSRQSMLVYMRDVEITGQDTSSGYYKFKLGNLETYVRISSSNNCITKEEQEAFKQLHTEKFGYNAFVCGIVQLYNGNLYLIPVSADAFYNCKLPERSDTEKIEMELGNVVLPGRITDNTTIELAQNGSTYPEVTYAWTSDNACAVIDGGKLTVTLPEEDATVTITLTVKCGSETKTQTFTMQVNSVSTDLYVPVSVETPAVDTAYKYALYQTKLAQDLYFAGYMSGNYLATTDKADKATDVYLEAVEGGYRIYFKEGEAKKYIDIYEYSAGKVGVTITDKPTCTYTRNADLGIWVANVAGGDYYLGTYNTYNTISASKTSYINAENNGVSQFPCDVVTLAPATFVPEIETEAVAGTAYKYALYQTELGQDLYFAGYMSGNYLATTDKADKATDVYLEAVEGGYRIYFMEGEAKKYIDIYEYSAGKVGVTITDKPTCTFTRNAELGIWVANVAGADYYLGTYKTYNTISASKTSYITAENKGVSQFPCDMVTLSLARVAPIAVEAPAADTAYKFTMHQGKLGQDLYFAGYMDGNYLATTDKISKATDVYVEAVEGGFRFYFMEGEAKKYIDVYEYSAGKVGVTITDKPTCVFNRNAAIGNWVATVAGADYYLGTYKTYTTISSSKTSYITAENNGIEQFPCVIASIEVVA